MQLCDPGRSQRYRDISRSSPEMSLAFYAKYKNKNFKKT